MSPVSTTRFDGKVAIVTGSGAGLGRSHAMLLASLGAAVVVNDLGSTVDGGASDPSRAHGVVEEILSLGGKAVADVGSVASEEGAASIVDTAMREYGRIDVLVNNAGILRDRSMLDSDVDAWNTVIGVHLTGAMLVASAAWPHLMASSGSIVSTTSATGLFGNDGQANYGAAKMGVVGLTRCWAVEGESHGIRANAVAPLAVTRMTDRNNRERVTGSERTTASDVIGSVFPRLSAEQVSPLVAWLAHEECQESGAVYSAGGGRVARVFIGESEGWIGADHSVDELRAAWDSVNRIDGAVNCPTSILGEFETYARRLGDRA